MTGDRPDQGTVVVRLDQLDAKLSIPEPRAGSVSRADLIKTQRDSGRRVVVITAPAGYGKTTLLTQWAQAEDRPVGWVSLDRFDDDPASLLTLLAAAYVRATKADPDLIADMSGLGVSVLGRAAPRLASAFRTSSMPFVLLVDDLHELRSPQCHDALSVVISGLPQGSQLVLASRSASPQLPRQRASGDASELLAVDLALDAAGAQQVFAAEHVRLPDDLAGTLIERTEGWPAGLYLAALIARDSNHDVLGVAGDDRYVADYLYRESLSGLAERTQRFLRRTSVLDRMCAPLCDAVMGESGTQQLLLDLEASNLFLVSLDRRREWFRYHALFREFLLGELRSTEPELILELQLRAADWFESNGFPATAVEHLLTTPARDRSARLVAELALPTYQTGQISTVQRWLSELGDDAVSAYPPLAVLAGWVTAMTGQTQEAERWAAIVDAASFDLVPVDGSASFDSARAMLRAIMCAAGPEQMMTDAAFAVAEESTWSPWRDQAVYISAEAQLLAGNVDEAAGHFAEASALAAAAGNTDVFVLCESYLAMLAMDRGDWEKADGHVERALTAIEESRMYDYATSVLAFACAARLAVHRGDRSAADLQLTRAMRSRPSLTHALPTVAVRVRLRLAQVYEASGDHATAGHLLREVDAVLSHRPALGALVDEVSALREVVTNSPHTGQGKSPLSPAELRILPYLQTHLTIREIGERLFISRNTVSTEVGSIYRKLGVSSRHDAIVAATAIGLLGG